MIRPTAQERAEFYETCSLEICAAARALRNRFADLGLKAPFPDDDLAWPDLADIAIQAAATVWRREEHSVSTSYPYLTVSRAIGASYGRVLAIVDKLDAGVPYQLIDDNMIFPVHHVWCEERKRRQLANDRQPE